MQGRNTATSTLSSTLSQDQSAAARRMAARRCVQSHRWCQRIRSMTSMLTRHSCMRQPLPRHPLPRLRPHRRHGAALVRVRTLMTLVSAASLTAANHLLVLQSIHGRVVPLWLLLLVLVAPNVAVSASGLLRTPARRSRTTASKRYTSSLGQLMTPSSGRLLPSARWRRPRTAGCQWKVPSATAAACSALEVMISPSTCFTRLGGARTSQRLRLHPSQPLCHHSHHARWLPMQWH